MRILCQLTCVALILQGVQAIIYNCEEIKTRETNKVIGGPYACVVYDHTKFSSSLDIIHLTNHTHEYSLREIAAMPGNCVFLDIVKVVLKNGTTAADIDCGSEFTLVVAIDAYDTYDVTATHSYNITEDECTGMTVLVSPYGGIRLENLKCEGDGFGVEFWTGDYQYTIVEYDCDSLPSTYVAFESAITLVPLGRVSFTASNNKNGPELVSGSRITVSSSGHADNIQGLRPNKNFATFQLSYDATVRFNGTLEMDARFNGSIVIVDGSNATKTFTGGKLDWTLSGNYFEVHYLATQQTPESVFENLDNIVIEIAVEGYCSCDNSQTIWLDVVNLIDCSSTMDAGKDNALTTIQLTLYKLNLTPDPSSKYYSRAAVIAYAQDAQIIRDFSNLTKSDDIFNMKLPNMTGDINLKKAFTAAVNLFTDNAINARTNVRHVIIISAGSYAFFNHQIVGQFKASGGIVVVADYGLQPSAVFKDVASEGYYLTNVSGSSTLIRELCDANCFCKPGQKAFTQSANNERGTPDGGCYEPSFENKPLTQTAAEAKCKQDQNGFLATPHSDPKQLFLMGMFTAKTPFWIGLKRTNGVWKWDDDSTIRFIPSDPTAAGDCVYSLQYTGFKSKLVQANCDTDSNDYVCQSRPCDASYYCY